MFAKYKNHDYIYAKNKRKSEIITTQAHKADSSFTKERNVYVKSIPEENLSTMFHTKQISQIHLKNGN